MSRILVVEDEKSMRDLLALMLRKEGYEIDTAESGTAAQARIGDGAPFDLVVSDISMPGMTGLELLRHSKHEAPETAVILMTAYGSKETAIEALNAGAAYYVEKPFDLDEMKAVVRKTLEQKRLREENLDLRHENQGLRAELQGKYRFGELIGRSAKMRAIFQLIERVDGFVSTIAVRGFHDQVVGLPHDGRRRQQWIVRSAQIAREEHRHIPHPEQDHRRAEDVTGRQERGRYAVAEIQLAFERHGVQIRKRFLRVLKRVERQRGMVFRVAVPVGVLGLFLLEITAVRQQDAAQGTRSRRAVDLTTVAVTHEQRDIAGMVQVRVREQDGVDVCGRDGERLPVAQAQLLQPLEQTAVHQDPAASRAHQVLRSRHRPRCAQKPDLQLELRVKSQLTASA